MADSGKRTIGKAIDDLISALEDLDASSRIIAIRAACGHLAIPLQSLDPVGAVPGKGPSGPTGPTGPIPTYTDAAQPETVVDIRSFKDQKGPSSAREMACLVAYYLQAVAPAGDRKQEIVTADLEKYFKQAGFPLPKKIAQVLIDAKLAGYFDSTDRGTYKLNAVGYNLVVHSLPRGSSGGAAKKPRKPAPKRLTRR